MYICIYIYEYIYIYTHTLVDLYCSPSVFDEQIQFRVATMQSMPSVADSFRKKATNYRALLQNETYKHKASYASFPPCTTGYG